MPASLTPPKHRVLVTGATGFIGSHVRDALNNAGHSVVAMARRLGDSLRSDGATEQWLQGDLLDTPSLITAVQNVDCVVHCAAHVGDNGPRQQYEQTNVVATRMLFRAAAAAGCRRFIHMSSLGVYAARDHYGTSEDVAPCARGIDAYTASKILAEKSLLAECKIVPAMTLIILRPGFTYGPGDRHVLPRLITALKAQRLLYVGSGLQKLNNTAIGNLTSAVVLALKAPVESGSVFNITDQRLVSRREFIATIADCLKLPEPKRSSPRLLLLWLTRAYAVLPRPSRPPSPPQLSMAQYKFLALNLQFSIAKAQRQLGYQPSIDFAEAMPAALAAWSSGDAT